MRFADAGWTDQNWIDLFGNKAPIKQIEQLGFRQVRLQREVE
jgi:hypothetical protein